MSFATEIHAPQFAARRVHVLIVQDHPLLASALARVLAEATTLRSFLETELKEP